MDNLTHGLAGAVMAGLCTTKEEQSGQLAQARFWTFLLGAEVPDIDIVTRLSSDLDYLSLHRGPSHSLWGMALLAGLITLFIRRIFPAVNLARTYGYALAAIVVHVFLDLLTSYGTQVFYPWNLTKYSWDILMIVDPLIIMILGLGLYFARVHSVQRRRFLWGAVMLVGLYIGGRIWVHHDLYHQVVTSLGTDYALKRVSVLPPVVGISNWNFIVETENSMFLGNVDLNRGVTTREVLPKPQVDPVVTAAMRAPAAEVFLGFARHPYLTYEKLGDRYLVKIVDMRYQVRNRSPFMVVVQLDRNLNVIDSGLGSRSE